MSTPSSTRNRSQSASDLIARQGDSPPEAQERGRRLVLHRAIPKERVPCNARQPNHAIWHRWLVLLQYDSIGSSDQFHCGLIHPLHDVDVLLPAFWIPTHNLSMVVPTPYVDGDAVCDTLQPDRHHRGSFFCFRNLWQPMLFFLCQEVHSSTDALPSGRRRVKRAPAVPVRWRPCR